MADMKSTVPPYQEQPNAGHYGQASPMQQTTPLGGIPPQHQNPMDIQHQYSYNQGAAPAPYQGHYQQGTQPISPVQNQNQNQNQNQEKQQHQYKTVTPLHALGPGTAPVDCPACGQRALTRIDYQSGNTTQYV
ncbi:hypothetical protein MMC24_006930 [Lignoscripta atroalba]|nr:hypothetical protein [Lignoscripta atroalba]